MSWFSGTLDSTAMTDTMGQIVKALGDLANTVYDVVKRLTEAMALIERLIQNNVALVDRVIRLENRVVEVHKVLISHGLAEYVESNPEQSNKAVH